MIPKLKAINVFYILGLFFAEHVHRDLTVWLRQFQKISVVYLTCFSWPSEPVNPPPMSRMFMLKPRSNWTEKANNQLMMTFLMKKKVQGIKRRLVIRQTVLSCTNHFMILYLPESTYTHVKHTAGIWQCMGVGLWQVLAGAGDVKGHPHHLDSKLLGRFQQVPAALQRKAKGHAGFSRVSLGGQLQQQSTRYKKGPSARH